MGHDFAAIYNNRVAGIVATLKAHHHIAAAGKKVGDLALAFVPPLGANDCESFHDDFGRRGRSLTAPVRIIRGRAA